MIRLRANAMMALKRSHSWPVISKKQLDETERLYCERQIRLSRQAEALHREDMALSERRMKLVRDLDELRDYQNALIGQKLGIDRVAKIRELSFQKKEADLQATIELTEIWHREQRALLDTEKKQIGADKISLQHEVDALIRKQREYLFLVSGPQAVVPVPSH